MKLTKFLTASAVASFVAAMSFALPAQAGDVQSTIKTCESCHGTDGQSKNPDVPIIAGMSDYYIDAQIMAYQKKLRPCPDVKFVSGPNKGQDTNMCKEVKGISKADSEAIAQFFAGKKFTPAKQKFDAAMAAKGKEIFDQECSRCHSEGGSSAFDDAGILAGQWRDYLVQNFQYDREGKRWMPEKMKPKIKNLSDQQVKEIIEYLVGEGSK